MADLRIAQAKLGSIHYRGRRFSMEVVMTNTARNFWMTLAIVAAWLQMEGCATAGLGRRTMVALYGSALSNVDRPQTTKDRYGAGEDILPLSGDRYVFEDSLLSATLGVAKSRVNFSIRNKSDHSLKLVWDEAVFIETDGQTGRVAHSGVKYVDRNESQPSSVIPAGSSLSDFVLPTNRIYYREGIYRAYYSNPGGWEELPLVLPAMKQMSPGDSAAARQFSRGANLNEGKRFGVVLPLEVDGALNEYTFWFEIRKVAVSP
jgi:hypothetical protein